MRATRQHNIDAARTQVGMHLQTLSPRQAALYAQLRDAFEAFCDDHPRLSRDDCWVVAHEVWIDLTQAIRARDRVH